MWFAHAVMGTSVAGEVCYEGIVAGSHFYGGIIALCTIYGWYTLLWGHLSQAHNVIWTSEALNRLSVAGIKRASKLPTKILSIYR